jgi:hypothetical protein
MWSILRVVWGEAYHRVVSAFRGRLGHRIRSVFGIPDWYR